MFKKNSIEIFCITTFQEATDSGAKKYHPFYSKAEFFCIDTSTGDLFIYLYISIKIIGGLGLMHLLQ